MQALKVAHMGIELGDLCIHVCQLFYTDDLLSE